MRPDNAVTPPLFFHHVLEFDARRDRRLRLLDRFELDIVRQPVIALQLREDDIEVKIHVFDPGAL